MLSEAAIKAEALARAVQIASPVSLAAGHNLLEMHNVWVATLLQHPDFSHGCDWDACIKALLSTVAASGAEVVLIAGHSVAANSE